MEENNAPNGSNSVDNRSSTHESGGTTNSARKSYRKRKRSTNIGDTLPTGRKLVIGCNDDFCQPNKNDEATIAFSTKSGVVARRDIPICYTDWRLVPSTIIENDVKCLGKYFEFDYQESIDTTYTRRKLNVMWKNYKHELYEEHVKDKNPRFARENPPPDSTIPLEDWQTFVANCNTQAFKESSERNTESREKQTLPSCSGRKLASVVRNEVGRSETYIALHTRKDKSLQCPELVDDLNTYMAVHPESRATAVDDALMHTRGTCYRGRFLGVGLGVSKSQVRLSEATRKKNVALQETNKELRSTITNMGTQFQQQMDELRALIVTRGATASTSNVASHTSSQAAEVDTSLIGKECYLRAGWPLQNVAKGIVQEVDPQFEFCGIPLGEDNYKVYVIAVMEPNILLPCPHDDNMILGQLGQGSIIWPKEALQLCGRRSGSLGS